MISKYKICITTLTEAKIWTPNIWLLPTAPPIIYLPQVNFLVYMIAHAKSNRLECTYWVLKESCLKKIAFFTLIGPLNPTQTIQMSCVNYHAKRTWPFGPYPISLMIQKVLNLLWTDQGAAVLMQENATSLTQLSHTPSLKHSMSRR
jgi:hypothetical protein